MCIHIYICIYIDICICTCCQLSYQPLSMAKGLQGLKDLKVLKGLMGLKGLEGLKCFKGCGNMAWANAGPKKGCPGRKTIGHIDIGDTACNQQGGLQPQTGK